MMFCVGFMFGVWSIVIFRVVQKRKKVKINKITGRALERVEEIEPDQKQFNKAFAEFEKEYGDHS